MPAARTRSMASRYTSVLPEPVTPSTSTTSPRPASHARAMAARASFCPCVSLRPSDSTCLAATSKSSASHSSACFCVIAIPIITPFVWPYPIVSTPRASLYAYSLQPSKCFTASTHSLLAFIFLSSRRLLYRAFIVHKFSEIGYALYHLTADHIVQQCYEPPERCIPADERFQIAKYILRVKPYRSVA